MGAVATAKLAPQEEKKPKRRSKQLGRMPRKKDRHRAEGEHFSLDIPFNRTFPVSPFIRWDEKAGLPRDAIRSQCSTCSKHNEKETGNAEDEHYADEWENHFQRAAHDWVGSGRSFQCLLRFG